MQKKKYLVIFVCILLCLQFPTFLSAVEAYSTHTPTPTPTHTPTPTPTPTQNPLNSNQVVVVSSGTILSSSFPTNLAPIPTAWPLDYGSGPQIVFLDNTVTHNGNVSIRLDQHTSADVNTNRECDSLFFTVKPGDHVVFKCWIQISASGLGDTNPYSGARLGIDFYDSHRITGVQSDGQHGFFPNETDQSVANNYVNWGTSGWVQKTIDLIVPNTFESDGSYYPSYQQQTPTGMILWMQVWSSTYGSTDPGHAWFSDATLNINP